MSKENRGIYALVAVLAVLLFSSFVWVQFPPRLQKKIDAAIKSTYKIEVYTLESISVSEELDKATKAKFKGDHLFKLLQQDTLVVGYIYVGQAPSMKKVFDYIILFNTDLSIKKSKVLIYREDYGLQIGSQRWLKQFIGLTIEDNVIYGENIDAIAGATISASSMTRATNAVLQSLRKINKLDPKVLGLILEAIPTPIAIGAGGD